MEHKLTPQEIIYLARQDSRLADWERAFELARQIVGDQAYRIRVSRNAEEKWWSFDGIAFDFLCLNYPANEQYVEIIDKQGKIICKSGAFIPLPLNTLMGTYYFPDLPDEEDFHFYEADEAREAISPCVENWEEFAAQPFDKEPCEDNISIPQKWDEDLWLECRSYLNQLDQSNNPQPGIPPINHFDYAAFPCRYSRNYYVLDRPPELPFFSVYLKEGATYKHILKREELKTLAYIYGERWEWERVHDTIKSTYGPHAHQAVIEFNPWIDDDGGLSCATYVYDKNGLELEPDLIFPFWQNERDKIIAEHEFHHRGRPIDWSYKMRSTITNRLSANGALASQTYDLDAPPPVPPAIYADHEARYPSSNAYYQFFSENVIKHHCGPNFTFRDI